MSTNRHTVILLDDDRSVLRSLERLLMSHGFDVRSHLDAQDFFRAGPPAGPACLLLDQNLGHSSGLEVHAEIRRRGWMLPTIFLTAHFDTSSVVAAVRGGADDFITKPYSSPELVAAVNRALQHAEREINENRTLVDLHARAARLSERERSIASLVLAGMLNKEIADHLQLALVTVKAHRGRAMKKLGAKNAAELARIAALVGLGPPNVQKRPKLRLPA